MTEAPSASANVRGFWHTACSAAPYVLSWWSGTRAIILVAFVLHANHPALALGNWDGTWYGSIIARGYEYQANGTPHNVAFFPLFPMLGGLLVRAGIPWPVAGALLNNVCFLAALFVVYALASARFDVRTARFTVAFMCALPLSLFGTVAYSEGSFMLTSALALYAFEKEKMLAAGLFGALATAARPTGVALALGLVAGAIRRGRLASIAFASLSFLGVAGFALYCYVKFGNALAFADAQNVWRHGAGIDVSAWKTILFEMFYMWHGDVWLQNWQLLLLVLVGFLVVIAHARRLGDAMTAYAVLALAMMVAAGVPISLDRNAYAVVPIAIAFGATWRRLPWLGAIVIALGLVMLAIDAARFAEFKWVA
jgi:hypothetical protein